mmetsp:Transcript_31169/g.61756  ORF Transcript_31169/g.61756 Transcript_31169/m.61756 type:complete len:492 (+) Transcript_31169:103-1578(+)
MSKVKVVPNDENLQGGHNSRKRSTASLIRIQSSRLHREITQSIKRNKKLLAKAELYFTAFLSITDMISDIVMAVRYYQSNRLPYALASMICVGTNLVLQSILVFMSHPIGSQVKEQAILWSLLKPGIDAHRVASKAETEEAAAVDARSEMTGARVIEVVAESIPGTIIQAMAMFSTSGGDTSLTPVLSLSSSILTSAFISAQLSHEWDASEDQRKQEPGFYGYLPESMKRRLFALFNLLLMAAFNLIIRTASLVIISQKSVYTAFAVYGGELALFFLVKKARGDFTSWVPVSGLSSVIVSFMMRLLLKVAVDWLCCAQFRHPQEVGGIYWSFTILVTCAIGIASALAHGDSTVTIIMGVSCAVLLVAFALFLASIEREYVATFFDTRTASEYNVDRFFNATSDERKFDALAMNENLWRDIRNDVKDWLASSLPAYLEEEPPWLTDYHRSIIPEWAVDDKALLSRIRNENVEELLQERRGSVANLIGALPNA